MNRRQLKSREGKRMGRGKREEGRAGLLKLELTIVKIEGGEGLRMRGQRAIPSPDAGLSAPLRAAHEAHRAEG